MTAIDDIRTAGQHLWLDDLSRRLVTTGGLADARDRCGVSGVTANPTIFDRSISQGDYDDEIAASAGSAHDTFWDLAVEDVGRAADLMAPAYEASGGRTGFVSIELSPELAYDVPGSVRQGVELSQRLGRHNVMIKVPGTEAGATSIEELTYRGVNVNVTLLFGIDQWRAAHDSYRRGLERRLDEGQLLAPRSVASFFLSRIDRALDPSLPDHLVHRAAIASASTAYAAWRRETAGAPWRRLLDAGALPQQLLWASTSPKADDLEEVYYAEHLVAPDTVVTVPPATLAAICAGTRWSVRRLDERDPAGMQSLLDHIERETRPMADVADQLQVAGVRAFSDSFADLLDTISRVQAAHAEATASGSSHRILGR